MGALIVERFFANRDPDRSRAANVAFGVSFDRSTMSA
jgi:hypothetical protein